MVNAPSSLFGGVNDGREACSSSFFLREISKPKRENLLVAAIFYIIPIQLNINEGPKSLKQKHIKL